MALSFEEAEAVIVEFCKTYPQALTITFNLAQTQEEIYGPENTVALRGRIAGSYRAASGGADFALANCDSNEKFETTLRHEILGHFGINTFSPSEKRAVLNAIIEARSEVGLETLWAYVDRLYPDLSDMRKAEEVYAFACEAIDPSDRSAAIKGQQSYEDVCVSRTRAMRISDLINLTTMVAEGLHDRTRSQQTFPSDDSAQFKQDSPMKTSEFPVWLAVPPDDREKMRAAAGLLDSGRAAVAWDKEEKLWYARPGCDLNRIQEWLPDRSVRAGGGDPESEFLDVLTQAGLVIKGMPVMNGTRQRVATTEDKHGKKSGVYTGYLDRRPAGWYVNYHRAESAKDVTNWTAQGGEADPMARLHIRAAAKQSQEDTARERAELHAQQTLAAKKLYDRLPAADPSHPYLVRKGIPPTPELRQTRNGALVVPFFNASGTFKTLQYIPEAGEKLLFKDAPKQGHFLVVGGELQAGRPVLYAEGYATARSLNLATGHPVVMTIDAGNMVAVAQILHQQFPNSQHLFMADFDHAKAENKGLLMATEAASKVGGQVLYPAFNESEIAKGFTDFNDLHNSRGLDAVRDQTAPLLMQPIKVPTMQERPVSDALDTPLPSVQPPVTPESNAAHMLRVVREAGFEPELLPMAQRDLNRFVTEAFGQSLGEFDGNNRQISLPVQWTGEAETRGFVIKDDVLEEAGEKEPEIFSVYATDHDGSSVWVADFESKARADEFVSKLQMIDANARSLDPIITPESSVAANEPVSTAGLADPTDAELPLSQLDLLAQQIQSLETQEAQIVGNLKGYYDNYDADGATIYQAESGLDDLRGALQGLRDELTDLEAQIEFAERYQFEAVQDDVRDTSRSSHEPLSVDQTTLTTPGNVEGIIEGMAGIEVADAEPATANESLPQVASSETAAAQPLTFTYNGQPATLNLQNLRPGTFPEATVIRPIVPVAPALPTFTFNGQPASLTPDRQATSQPVEAERADTVLDQAAPAALDPLASDSAQPPLGEPAALTTSTAYLESVAVEPQIQPALDEAVQLAERESVIQQLDAAPQAVIEQPINETTAALRPDPQSADQAPTQTTSKAAPTGLSDARQQWARSQPWFDGEGHDEKGTYVRGRELAGNRVQWLFRTDAELMTWADKQRPAPVLPTARASAAASAAPAASEALADAILVGPRIGADEPKPELSTIDKDLLLTRLTNELQGDKSMLYKLDNEPAFVDRGARLEMVPGAGQSDEKIMAALLTAAQFYRGEIELTGSAAFKAKAIELIVQHRVNVKMKTPEQRAMLDEARKAYSAPEVNPDAIRGDTPPPYDPAPPVAPIAAAPVQPAPIVTQPAQVQAAPAQPVAAQNDDTAPLQMPEHLQAPDPVDDRYAHYEPAQALDIVPSAVVIEPPSQAEAASEVAKSAARIDPSVHASPKAAEHGITGKVIDHGEAPFRFDSKNQNSVYITMRTRTGTQTFWGKELAGLLRETRIEPGRMATLKWLGQQPVVVQAPVKNPDTGVVVRYEEKSTHRNQWSLALTDGTTVRTGDDQGVKMVAYDAARFHMVQESIAAQLPVQIQEAAWPRDGLYWMTPNGQGSAIAGDALSAPRPSVDAQAAGTPIISSWSADGQLDMALYRSDGPYLQGVVRHAGEYQHVLVSLPDRPDAPPMVINAITEKGLVPIGIGNGINRSGGESVARDHIAFKLEGDTSVRIAKLDFPADVPPQLHHRLGFDERWKDTQNLPKSAPAPAPQAQPSAVRPS
jgi:putative DNA primase/helicase